MENFLMGTLILGLMFACCGTSDFASYSDCGTDGYYCMESAAINSCSPARTLLADDYPMEATITGSSGSGSCYIEIRALSESELYDLLRAEGADEATIQMFKASYGSGFSQMQNRKASCVVQATSVEEFLDYGDLSSYCTGDLLTYGYY